MQKNISGLMLVFVLFSLSGCGSGGVREYFMRQEANLAYIQTVAVLPFENHGGGGAPAQRIREVTITHLLASGAFDVVDKGRVDSALRAEAIDPGTPLDAAMLRRLGQRLGVQAFVLGTVETGDGRAGNSVYPEIILTMRLLDTETGQLLWQASGRGSGYSLVDRLFGLRPKDSFEVSLKLIRNLLRTLPKAG